MHGKFHDGLTSAAWEVTAEASDGALRFSAGGVDHVWPLADIGAETVAGGVRLARPGAPARLTVSAADWRGLGLARRFDRRSRRAELALVAGLAAAALLVVLVVFVGVPLASGPLARATPPAFEAGIGENFQAQLSVAFPACTGAAGQAALQRLGARLGEAAGSPFPIRVEAVEAPMVNAFALPGGAIVITDDLIAMTRSPAELSAVLAHEVAHVERRHVMEAVWRSLGFGLILDAVVGGGSGAGQQAILLAGTFADLRYSRDVEREADAAGQALLARLGLSSRGMASFFERLSEQEGSKSAAGVAELVSSHPDTRRRAELSRARSRDGGAALAPSEWAAVRAACARDPKRGLIPR
ncbi:MAG: M48 family metallopeptidase [Phenylobacterium sp.]|uniref:M48 family metallopeptidase n=1 Tax=Phenylobacterium sp. TaxID=1871053 RepID=UPI001A49F8B8|nr:M48 family metallopeptidase [Phenylobacterium sp.]MBL8771101.1 M48 family metallopeptidase [Phenylobacterium sp.]